MAAAALDAFEASVITNLLDRPRTAAGGGPHHANREQFHTDGRAAVVLAQLGRASYGRCGDVRVPVRGDGTVADLR